jgi:hypothetical protein
MFPPFSNFSSSFETSTSSSYSSTPSSNSSSTRHPNPPPPPTSSSYDPTSTSPYLQSERSLLSRLYLPSEHPNAINPVLALAIAACTSPCRSEEAAAFAIDSGREILATKITSAGCSLNQVVETEDEGRRRVRRAMDTAQASAMLGAFYHINGRWAEVSLIPAFFWIGIEDNADWLDLYLCQFHIFAPLSLEFCDLVGLDPFGPPLIPEYCVNVLPSPFDGEDLEERKRTVRLYFPLS